VHGNQTVLSHMGELAGDTMLRTSASFTAERRSHTRLPITSFTFIDLDDGNGGLILDLSEGGASVQAAEIFVGGFFRRVRFRLPNAENWIETSGKLVWQRQSQREAGIQFVELAEDTRNQIKNWVYSETFRPSMPAKKGRFKIVWEAEDSIPTSVPTTACDWASSLGYDPAMFPSERSIAGGSADSVERNQKLPRNLNTPTNLDESSRRTRVPFVRSNEPLTPEPNSLVTADDAPKQTPAECSVPRKWASWEPQSATRSVETPEPSQSGYSNYYGHLRLSSIATGLEVDDAPQRIPSHSLSQSTGTSPEEELQADLDTIHASSRSFPNEPRHAKDATGRIRTSGSFPNSGSPSEYRREPPDSGLPPRNGWLLPAVIAVATGLGLGILMMQESSNSKSADAHLEGPSVYRITELSHAGISQHAETVSNAPGATSRTESTPDTLTPPSLPPTGSVSKRAEHRSAGPRHGTRAGVREIDQQGAALSPPGLATYPKLALRAPATDESLVGAPPLGVAGDATVQPPPSLPPTANAQASALPAAPNDRTLDAYAGQHQRATIQPSGEWQRFVPSLLHAPMADAAAAQTSSVVPTALQDSQSGSGTVVISSHFHAIREVPDSESQPSEAGGNLQIGQLISIRQPAYPQNAARQRIEGTVKLRAIVGQDGTVRTVELVGGPFELAPAATSAVRNWRYEQTLLDGQPVESEEDITLVFRLTDFAASRRWKNSP
jgi:TonB family protein